MVAIFPPLLEFTKCKKLNFKAGIFFGEKFLRRSPTGNELTYPLPKSKLFDDFLRWDMLFRSLRGYIYFSVFGQKFGPFFGRFFVVIFLFFGWLMGTVHPAGFYMKQFFGDPDGILEGNI